MDSSEFDDLVARVESESLDFKREWHNNTTELIHDILCLTNSYSEENRYLIMGIDNSGERYGIEGDTKRRTNANLQDLLRQSNFNRIPDISIHILDDGIHLYDILEIKNRPDKPFFLTKDKSEKDKKIRNGVIYTRIGDTNIPLNETAPEDRIELMWRERFGIGKPPLERLKDLVNRPFEWEKTLGDTEMHHRIFPEFTLTDGKELNENFVETWSQKFPDVTASSFFVEAKYFGTVLKRFGFVFCDGYRLRIPMPNYDLKKNTYFLEIDSIAYKIAQFYNQYTLSPPLITFEQMMRQVGIELR